MEISFARSILVERMVEVVSCDEDYIKEDIKKSKFKSLRNGYRFMQ